ncbi:hypothetical protein [Yinghuangia seranimata]|uniref:hypothetical protein n=1 Tax=Yinghuangia seranimata TaxID=408067 RepID=UPI00248BE4FE|nr:hypothetical protein [Yinghuangia seranimata]MDI2130652.1 hypothetical protein [Yinghuangia seranimata]
MKIGQARRLRLPAVLAVSAIAVAACAAKGGPGSAEETPSQFHPTAPTTQAADTGLDCSTAVDTLGAVSAGYAVALDTVAFSTSAGVLQLGDTPDPDAEGRRFAKTGLVIRVGESAELSVPADAAERPAILWGNMQEPASEIRIPACPGRPGDKAWIVFAGGFYAERPMCVPLKVRSGGSEQVLMVPVGTACTSTVP